MHARREDNCYVRFDTHSYHCCRETHFARKNYDKVTGAWNVGQGHLVKVLAGRVCWGKIQCKVQHLHKNTFFYTCIWTSMWDFGACEEQMWSADQPAHQHSLINAFVISSWDSIIAKLSSMQSFSNLTEQAGLSLTWMVTLKTGFLVYYWARQMFQPKDGWTEILTPMSQPAINRRDKNLVAKAGMTNSLVHVLEK